MNNTRKRKPISTRISTSPAKGDGTLIEVLVCAASYELTPQGWRDIWISHDFTREVRIELRGILIGEYSRWLMEELPK